MGTWRPMAAANNAEWCDVVCRTHGAQTRFDDDAWTSRTRTPPYYPDAVTLVPEPSVPELLARIDTSPGCSIKDSFASLDLTAYGFRVLFEAEWIVRRSAALQPPATGPHWDLVRDADGLATWEQAWRGDDGPPGVFRAELLDHESVALLAARTSDHVVAGAILNRSSDVVGISNFFTDARVASAGRAGCLAFAGTLHPGSTFVGYESGDALDAARTHDFETAGSVRVWLHENLNALTGLRPPTMASIRAVAASWRGSAERGTGLRAERPRAS